MKDAATGISLTEQASQKETVKVEYYNLSGACLSTPHHGVNLVKKIDADGHATVKKVVFLRKIKKRAKGS